MTVFGGLGRARGPRASALAVRIAAIVLVLDAFVVILAGLSLYGSRQQYYARAEIISRNMSAILAETVSGHFGRIDFALKVVADSVGHDGVGSYLNTVLHRAQERVPEVLTFGVTSADGRTVATVQSVGPASDASLADRGYFQTLRDHPEAGIMITQPLRGRVSQQWVMVLARRITMSDGRFGGIVYASVPVKRLSDLFATVDLRPGDAIALRGPLPSLGIIARYPETVGDTPAVGNQAVSQELLDIAALQPDKGTYVARAAIDGIERVLSYHRVGAYPYYLMVGLSTAQMMELWWWENLKVGAACLAFILITSGGGAFAWTSLRARQALQGRLMLIEFAFNHQAEAVLLMDRQGRVVYGNAAATTLFHRAAGQLAGTWAWELGFGIARLDWPAHWSAVAKGEPVAVSAEIAGEGEPVPVVVTANYFAFGSEEFEVVIIRDIGEQLRYEKELRGALAVSQDLGAALARKNDELARFADILAHHMQEPVRQQHIFAQHLARRLPKPLSPETQMSLDAILDAAQRHRVLLRDAQSYLAWQPTVPPREPLPADAALDLALARLEPHIAMARATIVRVPLPALPIPTPALADVFTALLDNAVTYPRPGVPPLVHVTDETRDGRLVITVTDNGIGIPADYAERVFGVFERLNPQPDQPGTGIGLALTKKIIEDANGRIWIEQPEGPGTRVCFSLGE